MGSRSIQRAWREDRLHPMNPSRRHKHSGSSRRSLVHIWEYPVSNRRSLFPIWGPVSNRLDHQTWGVVCVCHVMSQELISDVMGVKVLPAMTVVVIVVAVAVEA